MKIVKQLLPKGFIIILRFSKVLNRKIYVKSLENQANLLDLLHNLLLKNHYRDLLNNQDCILLLESELTEKNHKLRLVREREKLRSINQMIYQKKFKFGRINTIILKIKCIKIMKILDRWFKAS